MTVTEAYESLNSQLTNQASLTVVLGAGLTNEELSLQRITLTNDLAKAFLVIAREAIPRASDTVLVPYDASYKPETHELLYIALDDQQKVKAIAEELAAFQNIQLFKGDDAIADHLKFYSLVVGSKKESRAVLLRVTSERIEISKGLRLPVVLRQGTFGKLKQKIFLFDKQVDCVAAGGFLFVLNKKNFERLFHYYEELKAHAAATVDLVAKYVPISNLDEFKAACTSQVRFMGKLAAISRKPYLSHVTMNDIKRVIAEFKLPVQIVNENGSEKIIFETALNKRWQILKLLDDDYLGSIMTNEKYAANSKMRM